MSTKVSSSKNNYQFSDNEYAYIGLSADQATGIADTNPVKFNTMLAGNVTFNPATYQVTLKKNRTYRLYSMLIANFSGNTAIVRYQFYNVTSSASIGTTGIGIPATFTGNTDYKNGALVIITPTVDTVIELRLGTVIALSSLLSVYSFLEIQQINVVSPVIQDPTRQNAYESPMFDIAVTSAGAGFVNTRTTGLFYKTSDGKWRFRGNSKITLTSASSIALTFTGVTFLSAQGGGLLPGTGTSGCWLTTAASTTLNMYFTSNSTYGCISFDVELASKPTGYAIPSDV